MGSIGPPHPPLPPAPDAEDEIVVVVTGFRPFKSQYPINPSWSIASSLPPFIPLSTSSPLPSHPSHPPSSPPPVPRIRILTHPHPIRVSYPAVRALVPRLWHTYPRIDFMIHIGLAVGRGYYSVERRGHRDGYGMADVDGVVLGDEKARDDEGGGGGGGGGEDGGEEWVWRGCPPELDSGVDVDDVWERWRGALSDVDVRISDDAGRYLCDFIYYSSLAELWKQDESRRVVFLHVPVDCDEVAVARGREVVIELIRALVLSREMNRLEQQQPEGQKLVT